MESVEEGTRLPGMPNSTVANWPLQIGPPSEASFARAANIPTDVAMSDGSRDEPPLPPTIPPDGSALSTRAWDAWHKRSAAYYAQKRKKEAVQAAELKRSTAVQQFSTMQLRQRAAEKAQLEEEEMQFEDEGVEIISPKVRPIAICDYMLNRVLENEEGHARSSREAARCSRA